MFTIGRGLCTAEVLAGIIAVIDPVLARHERAFLITDISHSRGFDAAARRLIVEWHKRNPAAASAVFGSNFVVRTLLMLIGRAASLLSQQTNTAFFATEQEARRWIDEQRRRLAGPARMK